MKDSRADDYLANDCFTGWGFSVKLELSYMLVRRGRGAIVPFGQVL